MTRKKRLLKYIILISAALFSVILMVTMIFLDKINYVKIPEDNENLGIKNNGDEQNIGDNKNILIEEDVNKGDTPKDSTGDYDFKGKIFNIVLLGGDRRNKRDAAHADSIIILSIDPVHKMIKLSSIMRDTYLNVHGHGKTKIANAYIYGGPQLTIRTLNENFKLKIKDYVFMDFAGFERLVDLVGGVEVDVKQYEIREINKYINEVAGIERTRPKFIRKPGVQTLNGQQALSYCRIRKVGNGDYQRTERQRLVLNGIINKVNASGPLKYPVFVAGVLPYVETSLSKSEIIEMGMKVISSDFKTVEQQRFPRDGDCRGINIDGVWYLAPNLEATRKQIHQFIYGDLDQGTGSFIP